MAFARDRHQPPGDWVIFSGLLEIAISARLRDAASTFADLAGAAERRGWYYAVELVPEPTNEFDPNAVAVVGIAEWKGLFGPRRVNREKIGYLHREDAAEVTKELISPGRPYGAELYSIYRSRRGYLDIKVLVLGPPGFSEKARRRARKAGAVRAASETDAGVNQS